MIDTLDEPSIQNPAFLMFTKLTLSAVDFVIHEPILRLRNSTCDPLTVTPATETRAPGAG